MRLLLLFSTVICLSSSSVVFSPKTGPGILEILIESGAPIDVGFTVTGDEKRHVTTRHLEPNIPELLIFDELDQTRFDHMIKVTIHDNISSHSGILITHQGLYDIDNLPTPFTGLQIRYKCAENRYGARCEQHCSDPRKNWMCDVLGRQVCAEGYCGWNCQKDGSDCLNDCNCKNNATCYASDILPHILLRCKCPPGYYGSRCEEFKDVERKLKFSTNFGQSTMVPTNKFSNRTDIYQLFEKYEKEQQSTANKGVQIFTWS